MPQHCVTKLKTGVAVETDYTTDEFEELLVEAQVHARCSVLQGNSDRLPFICLHCGLLFKCKGSLNVHRHKGCPALPGVELKVYPVVHNNQRKMVNEILRRRGVVQVRLKRKKKSEEDSSQSGNLYVPNATDEQNPNDEEEEDDETEDTDSDYRRARRKRRKSGPATPTQKAKRRPRIAQKRKRASIEENTTTNSQFVVRKLRRDGSAAADDRAVVPRPPAEKSLAAVPEPRGGDDTEDDVILIEPNLLQRQQQQQQQHVKIKDTVVARRRVLSTKAKSRADSTGLLLQDHGETTVVPAPEKKGYSANESGGGRDGVIREEANLHQQNAVKYSAEREVQLRSSSLHDGAADLAESPVVAVVKEVVQQPNGQELTKAEIELRLQQEAISIVTLDWEVGPRPAEQLCPGLFHFIAFFDPPLPVDREAQLVTLREIIEHGNALNFIARAWGLWYLENVVHRRSSSKHIIAEEEAAELLKSENKKKKKAMKLTMDLFKASSSTGDLTHCYKEFSKLESYMKYMAAVDAWEVRNLLAKQELQKKREEYVAQKLHEYANSELEKQEGLHWSWSPLSLIIRNCSIPGMPLLPWSHSMAEADQVAISLRKHRQTNLTNITNCPLIVLGLKLQFLFAYGRRTPISCPFGGLRREALEAGCRSADWCKHLREAVWSIFVEGSFLFGKKLTREDVHELSPDVFGLLGRHGEEAKLKVINKIIVYWESVQCRALGDMALLDRKHFDVLWVGGDVATKQEALHMFTTSLQHREAMDMAWLPQAQGQC